MIRIESEESSFTSIDWMNSDMLVAGSANGEYGCFANLILLQQGSSIGNIQTYSIKSAVQNNQQTGQTTLILHRTSLIPMYRLNPVSPLLFAPVCCPVYPMYQGT